MDKLKEKLNKTNKLSIRKANVKKAFEKWIHYAKETMANLSTVGELEKPVACSIALMVILSNFRLIMDINGLVEEFDEEMQEFASKVDQFSSKDEKERVTAIIGVIIELQEIVVAKL